MAAATPLKYAIFFIASMMGLILIFSVWNMVFGVYLVPTLTTQVQSTSAGIDGDTQSIIIAAFSNFMTGFRLLFFIMFGVGALLLLIHIIIKEKEETYIQPPEGGY